MFYFIIAIPFLLVIFRLLLTNIIIPSIKKNVLKKQLMQQQDWPTIQIKTDRLQTLYKKVPAKSASRKYRLFHLIKDKAFVYGEIDFLSFYTILERTNPSSQDVFYDLGSGSGKAVLSAMVFFNVKKSIGIEWLPPLYIQSQKQLEKAMQQDIDKEPLQRVQFINDSFLDYDFSDADILYVAATCLNDATWLALIDKMTALKPGSRIIVTTKTIQHEQFERVYQGIDLMSWGLSPVTIYIIKQTIA